MNSLTFADRLAIARHEIACVCVVISDLLERKDGSEIDWDRVVLASHRLAVLGETP